jgi:hypothetical protein
MQAGVLVSETSTDTFNGKSIRSAVPGLKVMNETIDIANARFIGGSGLRGNIDRKDRAISESCRKRTFHFAPLPFVETRLYDKKSKSHGSSDRGSTFGSAGRRVSSLTAALLGVVAYGSHGVGPKVLGQKFL